MQPKPAESEVLLECTDAVTSRADGAVQRKSRLAPALAVAAATLALVAAAGTLNRAVLTGHPSGSRSTLPDGGLAAVAEKFVETQLTWRDRSGRCLTASDERKPLTLWFCKPSSPKQQFTVDLGKVHWTKDPKLCMTPGAPSKVGLELILASCSSQDQAQIWVASHGLLCLAFDLQQCISDMTLSGEPVAVRIRREGGGGGERRLRSLLQAPHPPAATSLTAGSRGGWMRRERAT